MKIHLIYPHQLFEENIVLDELNKKTDIVYLVEDYLYFSQYNFHKQKLVLHRATMKFYEDYLKQKGYKVKYINFDKNLEDEKVFNNEVKKVLFHEFIDNYLDKKVKKLLKGKNIEWQEFSSPMFINTKEDNKSFFTKPNGSFKKPFMKTFYEWQRNRLNILMYSKNKPIGGKYSFDEENRKKIPKDYTEPKSINFENHYMENEYLSGAKAYISTNFDSNYGDSANFNYAINFADAHKVLQNFLKNKLVNFGIYEDAISQNFISMNHSVLTPYLNIGLLTPRQVLEESLKYVDKVPINSLEGFIRQIIGWREFMRAMYELHGTKMRTGNFFKHYKKLEDAWWVGEVKVNDRLITPINNVIKNVLKSGYNHHIERLMLLGNFMLLSEYEPDEVYKWFMTMYIDSYDWVMVPNVYGMSQFADGGIFATKPYVSGSNYIFKMSDYNKSKSLEWSKVWDNLFWSFLKKHKLFFSKNIRFKMLLNKIKD